MNNIWNFFKKMYFYIINLLEDLSTDPVVFSNFLNAAFEMLMILIFVMMLVERYMRSMSGVIKLLCYLFVLHFFVRGLGPLWMQTLMMLLNLKFPSGWMDGALAMAMMMEIMAFVSVVVYIVWSMISLCHEEFVKRMKNDDDDLDDVYSVKKSQDFMFMSNDAMDSFFKSPVKTFIGFFVFFNYLGHQYWALGFITLDECEIFFSKFQNLAILKFTLMYPNYLLLQIFLFFIFSMMLQHFKPKYQHWINIFYCFLLCVFFFMFLMDLMLLFNISSTMKFILASKFDPMLAINQMFPLYKPLFLWIFSL